MTKLVHRQKKEKNQFAKLLFKRSKRNRQYQGGEQPVARDQSDKYFCCDPAAPVSNGGLGD